MTMLNGKRESAYFIFWGLGVFGFGLLVMVAVDIMRFLLSGGAILWTREIVVFIVGLVCFLFSYFWLKKESKRSSGKAL